MYKSILKLDCSEITVKSLLISFKRRLSSKTVWHLFELRFSSLFIPPTRFIIHLRRIQIIFRFRGNIYVCRFWNTIREQKRERERERERQQIIVSFLNGDFKYAFA